MSHPLARRPEIGTKVFHFMCSKCETKDTVEKQISNSMSAHQVVCMWHHPTPTPKCSCSSESREQMGKRMKSMGVSYDWFTGNSDDESLVRDVESFASDGFSTESVSEGEASARTASPARQSASTAPPAKQRRLRYRAKARPRCAADEPVGPSSAASRARGRLNVQYFEGV